MEAPPLASFPFSPPKETDINLVVPVVAAAVAEKREDRKREGIKEQSGAALPKSVCRLYGSFSLPIATTDLTDILIIEEKQIGTKSLVSHNVIIKSVEGI